MYTLKKYYTRFIIWFYMRLSYKKITLTEYNIQDVANMLEILECNRKRIIDDKHRYLYSRRVSTYYTICPVKDALEIGINFLRIGESIYISKYSFYYKRKITIEDCSKEEIHLYS